MADYGLYEGVVAYAKQLLVSLAQSSKVAIFNDPNNQILTIKGKETAIREISTAGAGDYTGSWGNGANTADSDYVSYYAPYDRAYSASIDSLKEAQSYVEGAKPTLLGVATEYLKKRLAPEIDTVVLARYADQCGVKKTTGTDAGYTVDAANILETMANVEKDIANAGYDGDIVVFLSATANAYFEQALLAKNILANEVVIKREMTREELADGYEPITVEFRCRKYNNMLILPTPDDRMIGKVLMLNGIDPGQEEGGVLPQKNNSGFFQSHIIAIPLECAFANIRHIVNQLAVPMSIDVADYNENVALANEKLFGVVELENIGINQLADGFKFNSRCVYGGDIFSKYRDACVLVKGSNGAVTVVPVKAETTTTGISGAKTTTKTVHIVCEDLNCSGTIYLESATTASATVTGSGALTVPTSGSDLRPYLDVTVTFGNSAGSSKISVYSDSGKTVKIGEFTATSEG